MDERHVCILWQAYIAEPGPDLLCFGWDFHSLEGREKITSYLSQPREGKGEAVTRLAHARLSDVKIETTSSLGPPSPFPIPGAPAGVVGVMSTFTFKLANPDRVGRGLVRLVPDPSQPGPDGGPGYKALTLFLNVEDFVGHEEPKERPTGIFDGHKIPWPEVRAQQIASTEQDPTVLIVGGGQAGMMCAARMKQLGIRALVIEKSSRVGDVWRARQVPEIMKTYPKFVPKDMVADFLEAYAVGQNLVLWTSSTVLSDPAPTYDEKTGRWTVAIQRTVKTADGSTIVTINPKHIVMATGNGRKHMPTWPGMESFKGALYHSDDHKDFDKWAGKKAVVVGACNAAGDVAQSFLSPNHSAAEVTMVQRSATCVISSRTADAAIFSVAFAESRAIEDADFANHSMPYRLAMKFAAGGGTARLKAMDQDIHDGLREKGFRLTWEVEPGKGEVGLIGFFFEKVSSGTLLDFGCAQSIIDGKIKVKSGVDIDHFEDNHVVFADDSRIEADVVVLATGNKPIITNAIDLFGPGITEKIGNKVWGLDAEGELTRCYRPTGQPGLWFAPGAFQHSRFFSKHLALQILARELGFVDE
ncbi:FAD/NAD(P)-binding domain-containing protein [Punctularia strigosozonata HHB-11173 SS5]|uniref:FAD/NAD(P)-binding domain-containing protein n=1 Tax=Punctularia strigosozonata (strain HHB-11173) TaxID=741275 RepID=UPI0004418128|nr:FAD/NAD(P)-binding domain-containing protein [Punctularia strigosozonata HHB-11173 SS5]EIN12996.1 FAD/NAD(P)-binding domain-containing protein [Punctularia strigosozonata HHB-11173 SS5]